MKEALRAARHARSAGPNHHPHTRGRKDRKVALHHAVPLRLGRGARRDIGSTYNYIS
jgi:hypothetical protein